MPAYVAYGDPHCRPAHAPSYHIMSKGQFMLDILSTPISGGYRFTFEKISWAWQTFGKGNRLLKAAGEVARPG